MKKYAILVALILSFALIFAACSVGTGSETTTDTQTTSQENTTAAAEKASINFGILKGPTGMGAAYLLECNENGSSKASYTTQTAASPDVFTSALISGELDIAAVPTNAAATLYKKTAGKVKILAVNTLGTLYILDKTGEVKTVADLKGKTILSAGQGTTTEYVLNYVLSQNSLTVGTDVQVEFASEHSEVVSKAAAGGYDVILLPEPFVTSMKGTDSSFATAIDLTKEWKALGNGELTMGCVAVRTAFADENPTAVADFLADYEQSINYVNNSIDEAAALIEKFDIAKAAVAKAAIPNCNIVFMAGSEMQSNVSSYLSVLHASAPASVGGALPDDAFYYISEAK